MVDVPVDMPSVDTRARVHLHGNAPEEATPSKNGGKDRRHRPRQAIERGEQRRSGLATQVLGERAERLRHRRFPVHQPALVVASGLHCADCLLRAVQSVELGLVVEVASCIRVRSHLVDGTLNFMHHGRLDTGKNLCVHGAGLHNKGHSTLASVRRAHE